MDRLHTLKIILLITLMTHLYLRTVDAMHEFIKNSPRPRTPFEVALNSIKKIPSLETQKLPTHDVPIKISLPQECNEKPKEEKDTSFYSSNVVIVWPEQNSSKIRHHFLSQEEFKNLRKVALLTSEKNFNRFMDVAKTIPTEEFVALLGNSEERNIRIAELIAME